MLAELSGRGPLLNRRRRAPPDEVFTLDRGDFATYRARIGRSRKAFTLVS